VDEVVAVVRAGEHDVDLRAHGGRDRIGAAVEHERAVGLPTPVRVERDALDPEHVPVRNIG
jgi:hypothetical protein